MWGHQETAGMECSRSYSEVPKLIDFFKSEMPLRRQDCDMGKQDYLCSRPGNQQLWSTTNRCQGAVSPEPAIAEGEERKPSSAGILLVDFLGGNGDPHHHLGIDAAVLSRSSSAGNVELKHPMAKLKEAAGEHWSLQVAARPNPPTALKILTPTSTGTEESGTAAPKTPTCDMEITCRPSATIPDHYAHRDAHSADSGRFGISDTVAAQEHDSSARHRRPEIRKLPEKERRGDGDVHMRSANSGTSHGRNRLKRITASRIAPPPIGVSEETPTSRPRADASAQTSDPRSRRKLRPNALELEVEDEDDDDDAETIVQAATSLLNLSSNEGLHRPVLASVSLSSNEGLRRPALSSSETKPKREPDDGSSEPELGVDEEVGLSSCSVLSRPSNKRRYRLVVDLLAESP